MICPKCGNELRHCEIDSACYLCHQCREAYPVAAIERIAELEAENARLQSVIRLARISLSVDGTVEEFNAFERALGEAK